MLIMFTFTSTQIAKKKKPDISHEQHSKHVKLILDPVDTHTNTHTNTNIYTNILIIHN